MHDVGLDIVEVARIERAIARWGERFLSRVYTDAELELCRNRALPLAARFAGKEAVMKALGTGTNGVGWREVEILSEPNGKPSIYLHGRARSRVNELGLGEGGLAISLSHSREYALASVVG